MNLSTILATLSFVGKDAPAYKALFDQVVATFTSDEQELLQRSYANAMLGSDAAHKDAQSL